MAKKPEYRSPLAQIPEHRSPLAQIPENIEQTVSLVLPIEPAALASPNSETDGAIPEMIDTGEGNDGAIPEKDWAFTPVPNEDSVDLSSSSVGKSWSREFYGITRPFSTSDGY